MKKIKKNEVVVDFIKLTQKNGISLITLVITTIFSYDVKSSNNKSYLLATIL